MKRTEACTEQRTGQDLCLTKPFPKPMHVPTGFDVMSRVKTTSEAYQASDSNTRLYCLVFHRVDLIVRPLVGNRCASTALQGKFSTMEYTRSVCSIYPVLAGHFTSVAPLAYFVGIASSTRALNSPTRSAVCIPCRCKPALAHEHELYNTRSQDYLEP